MSTQDSSRWNARYAAGAYGERQHPSDLVVEWVSAPGAKAAGADTRPMAWDIACGAGRNSVYLARQGYSVVGLDIAAAGLQKARGQVSAARALKPSLELQCRFIEQDLESGKLPPLAPKPSVIINIRYLNLAILPALLQQLAPNGRLVIEVHLQADAVAEPVGGPSSDRFRAAPGALAAALGSSPPPHRVIYSNEGLVRDPDGNAMALAQLVLERL